MQTYSAKKPSQRSVKTALNQLATRKGRYENYSIVVCRDVYRAIIENEVHHLKNEVLEVLNTGDCQNDGEFNVGNFEINKSASKLSQSELDKLTQISEWCASRYGRYSIIARLIDMPLLKFKRRLSLVTPPTSKEVANMYSQMNAFIAEYNHGVSEKMESRDNECLFISILNAFISAVIDDVYLNIKQRYQNSCYVNMGIFITNGFEVVGFERLTNYHKHELTKNLIRLGLLNVFPKKPAKPIRAMLRDTDFVESIYLNTANIVNEYLEQRKIESSEFTKKNNRFSRSIKAKDLRDQLLKKCYEHYQISEKSIEEYKNIKEVLIF